MKKILLAGIAAVLIVGLAGLASADVLEPTATTVYFEMNGVPYNGNVDYEVDCYGTTYGYEDMEKGLEVFTVGKVYSYSASCPEYGCIIYEPYYLNYRQIDYCNLTADTDDGQFVLEKFASSPMPDDCTFLFQYDLYDGENYYKYGDGYDQCVEDTSDYQVCSDEYKEIVSESEIQRDDDGHSIDLTCTLVVDLGDKSEPVFSDVAVSHPNYTAIAYVKDNGVVSGYLDGTFRPDDAINRAEFTKILVESAYQDEVINSCDKGLLGDAFTDVASNEWYSKYICTAFDEKIIQGYPDGTFRLSEEINFAEAARIVVETFAYETEKTEGDWYEEYVNALESRGAIPTSVSGYDYLITRGDMAEIIYRLQGGLSSKPSLYPSYMW